MSARALIDFTLSNTRRFYSSMGNPLAGKGLKLCNPLGFSYIKNMLKDQLFKTRGFQLDNWPLGSEMFLGPDSYYR